MNILVLTAYAPVLHVHGGGVRMFHNIRILGAEHSVRVISFIESEEEREMLRSLDGVCEAVTAVKRIPDFGPHWLSVQPFLVREFSSPEMYRAVETEFRRKRVDVLQCEYLQMAQFHRSGVFTILTLHEMLSANAYAAFRRAMEPDVKFKLFYRWMQMLRYEVLMPRKFDRVVTMTENDADYLRSYSPAANIRAIPIGIDASEFAPLPEEPSRPIDVAFPGYVADTRALYHRPNTIVAAPLFSGTGQRVKLLEAFAMACSVVTSSVGGMGFPLKSSVEAFVADTVEDFAAALRQLISSEELRRRLGQNAREMIIREFNWNRIGEQLLALVSNCRGGL